MKILFGVVVVILLLLGLVISLPFLIDLNKYQDRYRPLIEDALNRKVTLQDIRLTIWPRVGARVGGFTIQDDPAFRSGPFASLSSLDVGVKLLPLLGGKVEVEEITLRDPVIVVLKDQKGVLNVSTLGARATAPSRPEAPPSEPAGGPLQALALLAVDKVSIDGGNLTFRDEFQPTLVEYTVRDLEFLLTAVHLGDSPHIHVAATIQPYNVPFKLDGIFGPLTETLDVKHFDFDLALGNILASFKGSAVGGNLDVTVASPLMSTADIPMTLPLTRPVQVKDLHLTAHIDSLHNSKVSPIELAEVKDLGLALVMGGSVINVKGTAAKGIAHVTAASSSIQSMDLPVALPLVKPVEIKNLHVSARANYPPKAGSPPLELADITDLGLSVTMGNSVIDLQGTVLSGIAKVGALSKGLNTADAPIDLPLKKPVQIQDLRVTGEMRNQDARLQNVSLEVFNGLVKAQGGVGIGSTTPPFNGKITLEGLQLGPALNAFGTDHVMASGTAGGNLAIGGRGFTMPDLKHALEGAGQLNVKDGKIDGINLMQEVATLLKVVGVSPDTVKATVFSTIESDFTIKQGLVNIHRLLMDSHEFQATGNGTVGLDQTLLLRLNLKLSPSLSQRIAAKSPIAKVALSGGRLALPLLITGTVQSPSYGLDTKMFAGKVQEQATQKAKEAVGDLLQGKRKPEDLKQQGKELLKDLFGR